MCICVILYSCGTICPGPFHLLFETISAETVFSIHCRNEEHVGISGIKSVKIVDKLGFQLWYFSKNVFSIIISKISETLLMNRFFVNVQYMCCSLKTDFARNSRNSKSKIVDIHSFVSFYFTIIKTFRHMRIRKTIFLISNRSSDKATISKALSKICRQFLIF